MGSTIVYTHTNYKCTIVFTQIHIVCGILLSARHGLGLKWVAQSYLHMCSVHTLCVCIFICVMSMLLRTELRYGADLRLELRE